jgi:geranylgeranyl diphosphate synthase type I
VFYASVWELLDRGGKRFRPALTLLACKAVGGDSRNAVPSAAAVELLHNMTLVHDDIEDESELRRGKPCIHVMFGVPTAINVGDAMLIKVFEVASQGRLPDVTKIRILRAITRRAYQITWGQAYEFHLRDQAQFTEKQVVRVLESKTSALIALAAEVGALAGGATRPELNALSKFGERIGLGFQIIDDVLNVVGEEAEYGKEIGGDIREGKRTVMAAHLVANAIKQDKERFLELLGKRNVTPTEIAEAVALYEKYGSIKYAREKAARFIDSGLRRLRSLGKNRAVEELAALANFLVERKF